MPLMMEEQSFPIPHEPGSWIRIRELSGFELEEAEDAQQKAVIERLGAIDPISMKNFREGRMGSEEPESPPASPPVQAPNDDLPDRNSYHLPTLFRLSIVGWSYETPCTDENKVRLDRKTNEWLADEIIKFNIRTSGE